MTIASYNDMKALIARRLKRSDLSDYIPDYIALAEARIYRELRVRAMETSFSSVIASGAIALPSGYLELKYAYVEATPARKLERKDAEWIVACYPSGSPSGQPRYIGRDGQSFVFGPYPDSAYTVKGSYYKRLDALSGTNTSNWLITDAPDLLMFASLLEAARDLQHDERIPLWEQSYQDAKAQIQRQDDGEEFSGSVIARTTR